MAKSTLQLVRRSLMALVILSVIAPPLSAQETTLVVGRVVDGENQPMPSVLVRFTRIGPGDGFSTGVMTGVDGRFSVSLPIGTYQYQVSRGNLVPTVGQVTTSPGQSQSLMIQLTSSVTPLIGLTPSKYFDLFNINYFSAGLSGSEAGRDPLDNANQVKFHVAVRYKLLDLWKCGECAEGLYVTYAQTSFWHLYDPSAPFFDNNYGPGVVGFTRVGTDGAAWHPMLFAGYVHQSNGRDGAFSRGWDRVIAGASLGGVNRTRVSASATTWYSRRMQDNPDLPDYAGRAEVEVFLQPFLIDELQPGWLSVQVRSRLGGRDPVSNIEANVLIHFAGRAERWFTPSAFLQFFSGYGENLLTYDEKRTVIRAGFGFAR